ncbi:uncharacterized protein LOC131954789 [Physella acuta]|uniref:uncharacterized protein LOC131954789 n=1 Tax=Physella acuta TaxID=109671 RepID=UPI0027DD78A8|nr:uncharacterized protein LOC131954789 [Physella acuta]
MPSRIQIKLVTEHMKYLEEQIQVMDPVIGLMKQAVEKSRTWIEDKHDDQHFTYIELYQELESATSALLKASSEIINENPVIEGTPSLVQPTPQTTATEKHVCSESTHQITSQVQHSDEIVRRLEQLEVKLTSMETMTQRTQDDTSEVKQWRDNFVTEHNELVLSNETLSQKYIQTFINLRKQIIEQDDKLKEMDNEIESLKDKDSMSGNGLKKVSLDVRDHENSIQSINKELDTHTYEIVTLSQTVQGLSDLMPTLQTEVKNSMIDTCIKLDRALFKHNVMCKLMQQRLLPVDKLIQIFNQNLETKEKNLKKLGDIESDFRELSKFSEAIARGIFYRYACHIQLDRTPVSARTILLRVSAIREYNGQYFNRTTGKFVSPNDTLYLVGVTLHEYGDKRVEVGVYAGDRWCKVVEVKSSHTSVTGSVVVDMKRDQELYLRVVFAEPGAELSCYSSFTIVSL